VKNSARTARVAVSADGRGLVSQAGAVLLWETMRVTGLGRGLSAGLARSRAPRAVHDPGKIIADLAAAVALGGDCLADIAVLREQPGLAGPVASDPVVSRLVSALAADLPRSLRAIRGARAAARERAWALAGDNAPGADGLVTVDLDATIVIAHSDKERAAPTWKKTFGFHPMTAWADHGAGGNGEPLAIVLRAGNAGSNTAADHIEATRLALAQLPRRLRRRALVRTDSGGGTRGFLTWLTAPSRRLRYSVGMTITEDMQAAIGKVPATAWTPACDGDGQVRDGAWVADITGLLDLSGWPAGMRVIVRKERPHPGAQLRFTDLDGHRFTAFATDAKRGQLADLELRHPQAGPVRGPDPLRQGHRAAEPPAQGLRPEPALVRDRRPGLRAAGLDAAARPGRGRPPLGTQTAPPAPALNRRAARARRPPPAAAARRTLALGRRHHGRRHPPAGPPVRLTSRNRHYDQERKPPGAVEPRPPGATAGQPGTTRPGKSATSQHLRPARQRRERSRLGHASGEAENS
jgi:Transposase DDE domain group 1